MSALPRGWEHESLFDGTSDAPHFDRSDRSDDLGLAGLSREDLELPEIAFPGFAGVQQEDGWGIEFPSDEPGQLAGRICGTPEVPLPEPAPAGGCFPTLPATMDGCDPGIMPVVPDAGHSWL